MIEGVPGYFKRSFGLVTLCIGVACRAVLHLRQIVLQISRWLDSDIEFLLEFFGSKPISSTRYPGRSLQSA
jgi:hypothetical protein